MAFFPFFLLMSLFYSSRAKKEVDEVIGMKQEISYEDLGKLVYLTQVFVLGFGK